MRPSTGWLLLLACALVQGVADLVGRRAALALAFVASGAHVALGLSTGEAPLVLWGALASFWVACGAMLYSRSRALRRHGELERLAHLDEATGCLNRRGFAARLESAVSRAVATRGPVALLALDLDHFKQVNDRFGHLCGDVVLCEVVAHLTTTVGDRGVVARLGGEEFAVLLPGADEEAAGVMAERILAALRGARLSVLPPDARLTLSAGIAAERVEHIGSAGALRARADEALYAAKRSGRDRALLWAPGVRSNATPVSASRPVSRSHRLLERH
jgi:diguanylate cyclase (GGDEF)-like protein